MVLISCDKSEQQVQPSETTPTKTDNLDYPWIYLFNYTGKYFEPIPLVCRSYLRYTTKLDISSLQNKKSYTQLSDGNLTITVQEQLGFHNGLTKYDPTNTEWWKDWGPQIYVESNKPSILQRPAGAITLVLSKKCYVFGFELGALLNYRYAVPVVFGADYYDSDMLAGAGCEVYRQDLGCRLGSIEMYTFPPKSVSLFAIKSDIPFDKVYIHYYVEWDEDPGAYAITNIRYLTNKETYEKHKND